MYRQCSQPLPHTPLLILLILLLSHLPLQLLASSIPPLPILPTPPISTPPPSNLSSHNSNSNTWLTALQKGTFLYQHLRSGCFPDKPHAPTITDLRAQGWTFGPQGAVKWTRWGWIGFSRLVVRTMGWSEGQDYWIQPARRGIWDDETADTTSYLNLYSPTNALIGALATEKPPHEPIHWSDATFAMWAAVTSHTSTSIRNLRYIGRSHIDNPIANAVLERAVPAEEGRSVTVFEAGEEEFLALLGTPNGAGVVYLLMEHKEAFGRKGIGSVIVVRDDEDSGAHVVFEVKDWDAGNAGSNCSDISRY